MTKIKIRSIKFYNSIAIEARQFVRYHAKKNRKQHYCMKYDVKTLRGFCQEVSEIIVDMLKKRYNIDSRIVNIHKQTFDGYNHKAVYVDQDDVIIDGTINQYDYGVTYAHKRDRYPFIKYLK